jgi:tRNA(Ile)-lysidine synthase
VLKQFLNHIERFQLCKPSGKILLAISGGIDSMAMLHLFREAGLSIGVAHANFQLRGEESAGDEQFIRETCAALDIPCFITHFNTQQYAEQNGVSIQMAARELRYGWFNMLLETHHYDHLATAHHVNDSIETTLLNWIHGASVESFAGIPVRNNKVIRPLLFATRQSIEQYAAEKQITWREDKSNQSDDYQRNFLRHQVIPKLREINPSLEQTVQRGLEKIRGDLALLEGGLENWRSKFMTISEERCTIDKRGFDELSSGASVLWRCVKHLGFNYDTCHDVMASLHGQPGKRFLSPSHELIVDRAYLIITPHVDFWNDTVIEADQPTAFLGAWDMEIGKLPEVRRAESSFEATLDAGKVKFPLRWRRWKPGDAFYPLGMEHRKKVSDFLIDHKVPVSDKNTVTVLESDGQIVWVVGYRIDHRYRITEQTAEAISFFISPHFI